jgi:hypothetical protein
MLFVFINDVISNHFGRNPVNGGKPANDNSNKHRATKENLEERTKFNS